MASLAKCKGEFCGEKMGILFTQFFRGCWSKKKCHGFIVFVLKGRGIGFFQSRRDFSGWEEFSVLC